MKQQPGKLGIREYISIGILMVGSKATEATPAIMYSNVQNAAWMVPILIRSYFFYSTLSIIKNVDLCSREKSIFCYSTITWKIYWLFYLPTHISH